MNDDKSVLKRSERLLDAAKKIFGDIVANAYVSTWDRRDRANALKELAKIDQSLSIDGDSVRHDAECVAIEFNNGAIVYFENSEWGSFGRLSKENIDFVEDCHA